MSEIWPKGFTIISRSIMSNEYKLKHKGNVKSNDFGKCQCKDGCKLATCDNANLLIECNSDTCQNDANACENRPFFRCCNEENVVIKSSGAKGLGCFGCVKLN